MIKVSLFDMRNSCLYIGEFYFLIGIKDCSIGVRFTEQHGSRTLRIHFLRWMISFYNEKHRGQE